MEALAAPSTLAQSEDVYLAALPTPLAHSSSWGVGAVAGPSIAMKDLGIVLELAADVCGKDEMYFDMSFFQKDIEAMAGVDRLMAKGKDIINLAYSYRSAAVAIPDASALPAPEHDEQRATSTARLLEFNSKILEVLRPEVSKLKQILTFAHEALIQFQAFLKILIVREQGKEHVDGLYESLDRLLDLLVRLQCTLGSKWKAYQCDLVRYQSATSSQEMLEEVGQLLTFYGGKDADAVLLDRVRSECKRLTGFEDVFNKASFFLIQQLDASPDAFSSSVTALGLAPDERYAKHRSLLFYTYLLDGAPLRTNSARFKSKVLQRALRRMPYVPVFADVFIYAEEVLLRMPQYDARALSSLCVEKNTGALRQAHALSSERLLGLREEAMRALAKMVLYKNRYAQYPFKKLCDQLSVEMAQDVVRMVREVLVVLAHISHAINMFSVFCLASAPSAAYVDVFRSQLGGSEVFMVSECVALGKQVCGGLRELEDLLQPCARYYTHHKVQQLVQADLVPLLHRLDKRNRPSLQLFLQTRAICVDYGFDDISGDQATCAAGLLQRSRDYKEYSRRQGRVSSADVVPRVTSGAAQERILRLLLTSAMAGAAYAKADLEKQDIEAFEVFLEELAFFPMLREAVPRALRLTDTSGLWLREVAIYNANASLLSAHIDFYGGSARTEPTKRAASLPTQSVATQVPADASLPFICINHLLSMHTQALAASQVAGSAQALASLAVDKVYILLDVYNDAANTALHVLNSQHLYDEVEAECTLLLDLVPLLLADHVYTRAKLLSCQRIVDAHLLSRADALFTLDTRVAITVEGEPAEAEALRHSDIALHYGVLATPLPLLGRLVDMKALLLPHILAKLRADADLAIRRFESVDACHVHELVTTLQLLRSAHAALRMLFRDALGEDFAALLVVAGEGASLCAYANRICIHFLQSLAYDIIPNCTFNPHTRRFVRGLVQMRVPPGPRAGGKPIKPKQLHQLFGCAAYHKALDAHWKLHRHFFGAPHAQAYLSLGLDLSQFSMVADQLVKHVLDKVNDVAMFYEVVCNMLPCQLDPAQGSERMRDLPPGGNAVYAYWLEHLSPLLSYSDIKQDLLQGLRELGNTIAVVHLLSDAQAQVYAQDRVLSRALATDVVPAAHEPHAGTASKTAPSPVEAIVQTYARHLLSHDLALNSVLRLETVQAMPAMLARIYDHRTLVHGPGAGPSPQTPPQAVVTELDGADKSMLLYLLRQLEEHLYQQSLSPSWAYVADKPHVGASSFAHFFSALLCLFCIDDYSAMANETPDGEEGAHGAERMSNMTIFGRGVALAGGVLLHLLQQAALFEQVDISRAVALHATATPRTREEAEDVEACDPQYLFYLEDAAEMWAVLRDWQRLLVRAYVPRSSYAPKSATVAPAKPPTKGLARVLHNAHRRKHVLGPASSEATRGTGDGTPV